ncbi:MAG: hypothetical protein Q8R04_06670 [Nanoarchaeota archaeon]|nr:hypothetical protein [Nanoarchaeota archaeon]
MKIKILQLLAIGYFVLLSIILKQFNILPMALLIAAIIADYFTGIRSGIKNQLYILSALSFISPVFFIFLLYLPFAVFGPFLKNGNFIRNYVLGYAISFIPSLVIYLISTYLGVSLKLPAVILIFYLLPLIAIFLLKNKSVKAFELSDKGSIIILAILLFTTIIAASIVDSKNIFIINGVREYVRVHTAFKGLMDNGLIPIYNPTAGHGEATYLWVSPLFYTQLGLANFFLSFMHPILFFNAYSFFILLISTLAIVPLLWAIFGEEEPNSGLAALIIIFGAVSAGLNFHNLVRLESIKQFTAYPVAYLLVSIILNNPKTFAEYLLVPYLLAVDFMINVSHAVGIIVLAIVTLLAVKLYDFQIRKVANEVWHIIVKNKLKFFMAIVIIALLPLAYLSSGFVFKEFLVDLPKVNYADVPHNTYEEIKSMFADPNSNALSLKFPDIRTNEDERYGPYISVFGMISFVILMLMFKAKNLRNFRIFSFGVFMHFFLVSFLKSASARVGSLGIFYTRTIQPYFLVMLVAAVCILIYLSRPKYMKLALLSSLIIAFAYSMPLAQKNITNIHVEQFASGEVYKQEVEFIKNLPVDGRIMTYGLFGNVVDYGMADLTGRYFSRNERIELAINRSVYEKIHGQNSFGEPDIILKKSGTELINYFRLGGYKYLLINACHPIGNYVALNVYPNYTYPLFQDNCLVFLVVNKTNYAEKVDLVKDVDENIYKKSDGYRYITLSNDYKFDRNSANFKDVPKEPEPLKFERPSWTKVRILGDFKDGDFVVFKEQYFTRWKAFMNSKQIPVYANNHDFILVRTLKGNEINLEYGIISKEKIFGVLSLIGALGLAMLFVIVLRESSEEDK